MKRVVMCDMMNLFIRNFSANSMTNDNGEHVGGLYGCLSSLRSIINKLEPDSVYIAWEGRGSSKRRKKILAEYKEGRTFTGFNRHFEVSEEDEKDSFGRQLKILNMLFDYMPVYRGSVEFLEADDLIAYLCRKTLKSPEFEKIIVSTDRDYFQLVNDSTFVYRPVNKKRETKTGKRRMVAAPEYIKVRHLGDSEAVISITDYDTGEEVDVKNLHPANHYLTKCFGEPSDNIEGIKGLGEKTFLKDFPILSSLKDGKDNYTIDDIILMAQDQSAKLPKYKKYILPENAEILRRNEKLIQLLEPDISLKSIQTIENTIVNFTPKFNKQAIRIILLRENISMNNMETMLDAFNKIKSNVIEI